MAFFYAKNAGFLYQNEISLSYMISWGTRASQDYLVGFLCLLSSQARGTSVKSSLFPSSHKGMFDESMAVWGPSLRSFPAIFTDHGHINKVILFSECLQGMVGTSLWMTLAIANFLDSWKLLRFSENFKIFGKFWDFWKILRFSKNFEIFKKIWDFRKNWDFRKILRFSENFEIFRKFWDFWKILRFSENFKIFGKFLDFWKILRFSEIF